ncbi:MAG: twin-arginine translocase TatA/TatE family subunit [Gaiellales bacterium]|jgi:sec-independent protein translocase protein TatA
MPDVSPIQLVIVLVIALVILGPKRLPDVGKSLGRGIREFKDSVSGNDPAPAPEVQHGPALPLAVESVDPLLQPQATARSAAGAR